MENILQKKFDIFIAFHGDEITGSLKEAKIIYDYLSKQTINNRKLEVYLHPVTNPAGRFADTPMIIQNSTLLLLVANGNVPRETNGTVAKYDYENKEKRLFQELKSFSESDSYRTNFSSAARVICGEGLSYSMAEKLHFIFNGCEHYKIEDVLNNNSNLLNWISYNLCGKPTATDNQISFQYENKSIAPTPSQAKVVLKVKDIPYYTSFISRKQELEKIDEMLLKENFLILSSKIRGVGLNTLAKNYVKTRSQKYKYVHYVQGVKSIADMVLGLTFENNENYDLLPQKLQLEEKIKLFKMLDESTIILIADFDNDFEMDDLFYDVIANCKCKVLITSKYSSSSYPCLQIGNMTNEDLIALFRYYCKASYSDEQLSDFFKKVYYHSSTIYLVAKLIESSDLELFEVSDNLLDIDEKVVSSENRQLDTINNHLLNVFNLSKKMLDNAEMEVLQILSLFDVNGIERKKFIELYPEYKEKVEKLIKVGHIFLSDERPKKVFLPVFISDLIYHNFDLDENTYNKALEYISYDSKLTEDLLSQIDWHNKNCKYYEFISNQRKMFNNEKTLLFVNDSAMHYYYLAQYEKALQVIEKGFELCSSKDYSHELTIKLLITKILILEEVGKYFEARDLLATYLNNDDVDSYGMINLAILYNLYGSILRRIGNYEESIKMHLKAKELLQKMQIDNKYDDKEIRINLAISYNDLGSSYERLKQNEKALECKLIALETRQDIYDEKHPDLAKSYNNVGNSYNHVNNYDKAVQYILKSIELREKMLPKMHPDLAKSYNNLGYAYRKLKRFDEALNCYEKAININRQHKYISFSNLAYSLYYKSFVYSDMHEYEKALETIKEADDVLKETNYSNDLIMVNERMLELASLLGNDRLANECAINLQTLYQKVGNEMKAKEIKEKYGQ